VLFTYITYVYSRASARARTDTINRKLSKGQTPQWQWS